MRKSIFIILFLCAIFPIVGQNNVEFQFSGFVRGDAIFNTRKSVAALEELFYLYPKDHLYDDAGKDLNAVSSSGFYTLATRAALDVSGLRLWDSNVSAKIEADFAGSGGNTGTAAIVRLRQAYIKMDWRKSSLLIGQSWHPMFQNIQPGQLTLSTGAPFQPFNRSPQIRFDYKVQKIILSGSAIYQLQNKSTGPLGKSNVYSNNAILPELNALVEYKNSSIQTGIGINFFIFKASHSI